MTIGLTLTYLTTKVPNFAYGSFVAVGIYVAYTLNRVNGLSPYISIPVSFVLVGLTAVAVYVLVVRPLVRRGASLVSQMIATLAVDVVFVGIISIYASFILFRYGLTDALKPPALGDFSLLQIRGLLLTAPISLAVLAFLLFFLLNRTKFGIAMRASVENPDLGRVLGINVDRIYIVSWFLAGGLAGLSGPFFYMNNGGSTSIGSEIIVRIFAAAVLGGLASITGAILGGLIIGGGEIYLTFLGSSYIGNWFGGIQQGIPLVIMIATLLLFPRGLVSLNWKRIFHRGGSKH